MILGEAAGTVKFFKKSEDYGFIRCDDGTEVVFHGASLKNGVKVQSGDRVDFEVRKFETGGTEKRQAIRLRKARSGD